MASIPQSTKLITLIQFQEVLRYKKTKKVKKTLEHLNHLCYNQGQMFKRFVEHTIAKNRRM